MVCKAFIRLAVHKKKEERLKASDRELEKNMNKIFEEFHSKYMKWAMQRESGEPKNDLKEFQSEYQKTKEELERARIVIGA